MKDSGHENRFADERGFTLAEVLVTILLMVLVLFALYSIFDTTLRVLGQGQDGVKAAQDARAALSRMEREIRAANRAVTGGALIDTASSNSDQISFCSTLGDEASPGACTNISYGVNSNNELVRAENGNAPQVLASLGEEDASAGIPADSCDPSTASGGPEGSGGCLEFRYFDSVGAGTDFPDTDTSMVRIGMVVEQDSRKQILITNVALRNSEAE